MSFMGGAECSTAGNPLSQLAKHAQDDKSLQRDRLVNRGPAGGSLNGFRSAVTNSAAQDEAMNSFLHQPANLPEMTFEHGHRGGYVRVEPAQAVHLRAHSASPAWTEDFNSMPPTHQPGVAKFNMAEFATFQQQGLRDSSSARSSPVPSGPQYQQRPMMGVGLMNMDMNMGMGVMGAMGPVALPLYRPMSYDSELQNQHQHQHQHQHQPQITDIGKGKGKEKVVELDDHKWEEQFAQIELQDKQIKKEQQQQHREEEDESLAMEPELNRLDSELLESETGFGDFESIWNGIQAENAAMGSEWNSNMGMGDWDVGNSRIGADPPVEDYLFEEENLFQDQANPFEEGVRIMEEGGNLSLAALAFEAAVQKDPRHVEAWVLLGSAQAQNEKEDAAIRALERSVKLDPNNLAALMGLAISYTNEGYDSTSHRTLERWLSVKYPQIISPDKLSSAADMGFTDRQLLHDRVTELFLQAARLAPDGQHMDPDVQVGLGVLFYSAEEYDKAVDCFSAALASSEQGTSNQQSQIHLLWNRLGATLANSGRSEDAISAYEKALSIRPNFVRARYNLGVSCINMNCEREAAGHLLAALAMHKEVEKNGREKAREILGGAGPGGAAAIDDERLDRITTQNRSTTLYDTLRRVFTQMGRRDLTDRVVVGVDPDSFRGDFDF